MTLSRFLALSEPQAYWEFQVREAVQRYSKFHRDPARSGPSIPESAPSALLDQGSKR